MIAHVEGAVRRQDGDEHANYLRNTGVAAYAAAAGDPACACSAALDDRTELMLFTPWDCWTPSRTSRERNTTAVFSSSPGRRKVAAGTDAIGPLARYRPTLAGA